MIYEGEISGIVERDNKNYIILDTPERITNSRKYSDRYVSLLRIDDKTFKKIKKGYVKRAFALKSKIEKKKKFSAKKVNSFELYAESELCSFLANKNFLDSFKKFYKKKKGARALNEVTEKDVRVIENLASRNPKKVEEILDLLGKLRAELSKTREWKKILDKDKIRIALIFPYYNEPSVVANIRDIWDLVEEGIVQEVILADGWSSNPSTDAVKEMLDAQLTVVKNPGTGKGEALEAAVKYAFHEDFDFVICLDSDILPPFRHLEKIPPTPVDITCNFFARRFIELIVKILKKYGKEKAKETFYKAVYMRIPKSGKELTPLRFGGTTKFIKKWYKKIGFRTMGKCLYPLSGEYAFNSEFLLENLTINEKFCESYGEKYSGATIPSGFTIENFWNTLIEINGLTIAFCNTFIHNHIPRGEKSHDKSAYPRQLATVFRGGFGAMLQEMPNADVKNFDYDLFRIPRPNLRIKIKNSTASGIEFL